MSDDQLMDHLRKSHNHDSASAKVLIAELDRRDARDAAMERRKTKRAQERDDHELALEAAYIEAEHETRGHMLSKAGRAAGIDPRTLWTGTEARARKYGSEELLDYFDRHGRLTRGQFKKDRARHGGREQAEWEDEQQRARDRLYGIY